MDQFQTIGADIVKVAAHWRWVAPDVESSTRPNVDLSDPANYNWSVLDHAVKGIEQRGMTPWLMITAPAPDWASSRSNSVKQPGVWQPDPKAFGVFAEAIAKRYPEVRYWSLMNEPNFDIWLAPQVGARGVSLSAIHYRKMYVEGRSGLDRGGAGADQIMFGELAPRAFDQVKGAQATQPVRFLRDFFCLDSRLKPLKGSAAKARACTGRYEKSRATGFAHHPYTVAGGPSVKPQAADDAPIGSLSRIYRVLDKAYAYKRLSQRKIPLWDTEFGYQSNPPDIFWTPIRRVAQYLNASEQMSYRDPRVRSYAQYQLQDEPLGSGSTLKYSGFQSGLFFADGTAKAGPLDGYRLPLVVNRTRSANKVSVWGAVRKPSSSARQVLLQVRNGSGTFSTVKSINLRAGARYFSSGYSASKAAKKTYRTVVGELLGYPTGVTRRVDPRRN